MNRAMDNVTGTTETLQKALDSRIRRELPMLTESEASDVARVVGILIDRFQPDRIYVFGSRARGTPTLHSDVDLLVVVPKADAFPHRLAQQAYRAVGHHALPLDMVFMGREEFGWRAGVVTSLPATVLREGHLLYAATAT